MLNLIYMSTEISQEGGHCGFRQYVEGYEKYSTQFYTKDTPTKLIIQEKLRLLYGPNVVEILGLAQTANFVPKMVNFSENDLSKNDF